MLSKPLHGWTTFSLDGIPQFKLSYLDDIAFEWLDHAIHGLQTMLPFCVKGFLEPKRFLCVVSYWNCHIIIEDEDRYPLEKADVFAAFSHTSMLDFCKHLHADISSHLDDWAYFIDNCDDDETFSLNLRKQALLNKLSTLKALIDKNEARFEENRCFL